MVSRQNLLPGSAPSLSEAQLRLMSATALQAKDQIEEGLKEWDPAKNDKTEVGCFISWPMLLCTALCSCAFVAIQPWAIVTRDEIV